LALVARAEISAGSTATYPSSDQSCLKVVAAAGITMASLDSMALHLVAVAAREEQPEASLPILLHTATQVAQPELARLQMQVAQVVAPVAPVAHLVLVARQVVLV
jgi:hypothetical protein